VRELPLASLPPRGMTTHTLGACSARASALTAAAAAACLVPLLQRVRRTRCLQLLEPRDGLKTPGLRAPRYPLSRTWAATASPSCIHEHDLAAVVRHAELRPRARSVQGGRTLAPTYPAPNSTFDVMRRRGARATREVLGARVHPPPLCAHARPDEQDAPIPHTPRRALENRTPSTTAAVERPLGDMPAAPLHA
jgi:hypothetical protein